MGPGEIDQFFHGTTVATNIIIEHDGAEVGLITTRGFRDILHIARHKKPLNWSNFQDLPWQRHPLARRRNRIPVTERVTAPDGEVLLPLAEDEVRDAVRKLKAAGVEAIAVCFLFSFLNPEHERRTKEIVLEEFPEAFLSVRHEVLPQYREYEGFSTVCLNAYVGPKVSRYVRGLAGGDAGARLCRRVASHDLGRRRDDRRERGREARVDALLRVRLPASSAASGSGRTAGTPSVISLDVGGTSADIGVAPGGEVRMRHLLDTKVGELPRDDPDGRDGHDRRRRRLDRVRRCRRHLPRRSAQRRRRPGPGLLRARGRGAGGDGLPARARPPTGGRAARRTRAARRVSGARGDRDALAASRFMLSVEEAALAALKIQTHTMVQAIEENSVRRGYDPRDFALVAFGGGGPLYACDIAQELGIPQVVIPPHPGITSAMGLLATNVAYDYVKTKMELLHEAKPERLEADFARARGAGGRPARPRRLLRRSGACSSDRPTAATSGRAMSCESRCRPEPWTTRGWSGRARRSTTSTSGATTAATTRRRSRSSTSTSSGSGTLPELALAPVAVADSPDPSEAETGKSEVTFVVRGEPERLATRHYDRTLLRTGHEVAGPAIIHQFDSTTVVNPGLVARVDAVGNLLVDCSAVRDTGLTSLAPEPRRLRDRSPRSTR